MTEIEFHQLYENYKENVWRLVSKYALSQHDREDLFQDVFLNIHKAWPKFRWEAQPLTWIYQITVNTALNFLKKRQRYHRLLDVLANFRIIEVEDLPEGETGKLNIYLKALNPQQRMVLLLAEVEEKKLEEIAQLMKLPLGTVKSTLHRAKEIIRKELSQNDRI